MQYKPTGESITRVMITYDVTDVEDWTPPFKSKSIAPAQLRVVWENGKPFRAGVMGRFRLKSGKLGEETGSGDASWDTFYDRTDSWRTIRSYLPDWAIELIEAETEFRQADND